MKEEPTLSTVRTVAPHTASPSTTLAHWASVCLLPSSPGLWKLMRIWETKCDLVK